MADDARSRISPLTDEECSPEQLALLGPAAMALGEAEGLAAHARSVAIRLNR